MNKTCPMVLILDDDSDLLEMYKEILNIEGVTTLTARNGREGLILCKEHPEIQVIISDSNMGEDEMTGLEFLEALRRHYQTMPVFYLLTGAFDISEKEIVAAGGTGLILKPFDLNEILGRIKKDIKF